MELRQLTYFTAVCDEGNFTKAAERLHVVQSAVSAAIKALEHELHATLFVRSSKMMELTEAGLALLPQARATLAAAQAAVDVVDQVRGGLRGSVRIGTMSAFTFVDLPSIVGRFHQAYPEVTLALRTTMTGSMGLMHAILDGDIDLALCSMSEPPPPGIDLHAMGSLPLELVVREDHRLAHRLSVSLEEVQDEPFIDFPIGFGNRTIADRAFADLGHRRHVIVEIADAGEAALYVRAGLGVALVPRPLSAATGTVNLPLTGTDVTWPVQLATSSRRPLSLAAARLREMVLASVP